MSSFNPVVPGPGDLYQYDLGANKGMVKFYPDGRAHHTVIGGIDEDGQGVRFSWDADRYGNVRPSSPHPGEYPLQR